MNSENGSDSLGQPSVAFSSSSSTTVNTSSSSSSNSSVISTTKNALNKSGPLTSVTLTNSSTTVNNKAINSLPVEENAAHIVRPCSSSTAFSIVNDKDENVPPVSSSFSNISTTNDALKRSHRPSKGTSLDKKKNCGLRNLKRNNNTNDHSFVNPDDSVDSLSSNICSIDNTFKKRRQNDHFASGSSIPTDGIPVFHPQPQSVKSSLHVTALDPSYTPSPVVIPTNIISKKPSYLNSPSVSLPLKHPSQPSNHPFSLTIRPLMGQPFNLKLPSDASLYELKDQIMAKTGIDLDRQVISLSSIPSIDLNSSKNEALFLDELGLPHQCILNLSVKLSSGLMTMVQDVLEVNHITPEDNVRFTLYYDLESGEYWTNSLADDKIDSRENEINISSKDIFLKDKEDKVEVEAVKIDIERVENQPIMEEEINDNTMLEKKVCADLAEALGVFNLEITKHELMPNEEKNRLDNGNSIQRPSTPSPILISPPSKEVILMPSPIPTCPSPPSVIIMEQKDKCQQCNKRCRLSMRFLCKCGGTFCSQHRWYDAHFCTFDYKKVERERLGNANPKMNRHYRDRDE